MGILDNIGIGKKHASGGSAAKPAAPPGGGAYRVGARAGASPQGGGAGAPGSSVARRSRPGTPSGKPGGKGGPASRLPGKKRRKGGPSPKERIASAAAPLHDRRRRLVGARESTLRDLGGLMLEMYKRNRFREELLLDKCEEVLAIEVEIAHVDQRLFQLAPPNAAGMRPIGRCECGAPIHPGQNFCGVCGRSFATLTQGRSCTRCGAGLRPGDQFCATCGTEAPDALQAIEAAPPNRGVALPTIDAASIASSAVADTVVIEALDAPTPTDVPPLVDTPVASAPATDTFASPPLVGQVDAPAPAPAPEGFDWTTPPAAPEAAIDAALESLPSSPTDPATPFAGFPLTSTMPPPPIADPGDVEVPSLSIVRDGSNEGDPTLSAPAEAPMEPAAVDLAPSPQVMPATPAPPQTSVTEAGDAQAGAPATNPMAASASDAPLDPKAAKAAAKVAATAKKNRAKAAKARAKQRAKAAREARKRGEGE